MSLKLVLMGTGEFAGPTFTALSEGSHEVAALVTQPSRSGPGHHDHANPLKEEFLNRDIPVWQPIEASAPGSLEQLAALEADLFVVAAYGQILKPELLALPRLGAINVHASLLPRHRGASPIHHAILAGDEETGITIFQIEPRGDTGPVLGSTATRIGPRETSGELHDRLALLAVDLAVTVIDGLADGTARPQVQDDVLATRAPRLKKSDAAIDWSVHAAAIDRRVRAMQPWPKPFTFLHSTDQPPRRLILVDVVAGPSDVSGEPGLILETGESGLVVRCADGSAVITRLQPEGRRVMDVGEFLRGTEVREGDRLGPFNA